MMVAGKWKSCLMIFFVFSFIHTGSEDGFKPVCIYGRKARLPLLGELREDGTCEVDKVCLYSSCL